MNRIRFFQNLPLFAFLVVGGFSLAETLDNSGRIFPYTGYLEKDSAPAQGAHDIKMDVFTSSDGAAACDTLVFSDVQVDQGRFSVLLELDDNCFAGTSLYLEMAVALAGETPIPLASGTGDRVLVGSVPSAAQGSAFSRFFAEMLDTKVLNVDGQSTLLDLEVTGNTLTADLNVEGDLTQDNGNAHLNDIRFSRNWSDYPAGASDQAEIANDTGSYKALMIGGNRSAGGARKVNLYDDVFISGGLQVQGDLSLGPHISYTTEYTRSCHNTTCNSSINIGPTANRLCFLTRVDVEETDTIGEGAGCHVYDSGGSWFLRALVQQGPDADAWCAARCLQW